MAKKSPGKRSKRPARAKQHRKPRKLPPPGQPARTPAQAQALAAAEADAERTRRWADAIQAGKASYSSIAEAEGLDVRTVMRQVADHFIRHPEEVEASRAKYRGLLESTIGDDFVHYRHQARNPGKIQVKLGENIVEVVDHDGRALDVKAAAKAADQLMKLLNLGTETIQIERGGAPAMPSEDLKELADTDRDIAAIIATAAKTTEVAKQLA